jgi:hypothetical protein
MSVSQCLLNYADSIQCVVYVVDDPQVPIVHIKFEGEHLNNVFFGNKHEEVEVHCDRIER